jgi:hypothetical protein
MLQVNVARLHDDNREALSLAWVAGREGGTAVRREAATAASLIGHLNLTHPNSIQVIGATSRHGRRVHDKLLNPIRGRHRRRRRAAQGADRFGDRHAHAAIHRQWRRRWSEAHALPGEALAETVQSDTACSWMSSASAC